MRITYSKSGVEALHKYQERRKHELEQFLRREKYVLGDEELEITAADVASAERFLQTAERPKTSTQLGRLKLLLKVYLFFGCSMLLGGIFYNDLAAIFTGDPIRRLLLMAGITFVAMSALGGFFVKERLARRRELELLQMRHEMRALRDSERDS